MGTLPPREALPLPLAAARHPGTDAAEPWKGGAPVSEAEHVEGAKTEAAGDAEPAAVAGKPSRSRRMIHILGAALVGVVLPVVLLHVFLGELGSRAMVMGLLLGVIGSKLGGTRRMLYLAPAVGIALRTRSDHRLPLVVGGAAGGRGRHRGRRDAVRVAAVPADADLRRHVPGCDVVGEVTRRPTAPSPR